jgi:MoxR-like ATPase
MEERQVTVDGITRRMSDPFFVVATQNPVEQEGTYKLPEAQLEQISLQDYLVVSGSGGRAADTPQISG